MIIATVIFLVTLVVIFTEWIPRTIAAIVGAGLMVGVGIFAGFYSEELAKEAIDFHTIGLLLGMMTLVALLQPTGFFEYLATLVGRLSKGKPILLLIMLGTVTTVLSMLLDNVTTVVIIAPVAILIGEILGIKSTNGVADHLKALKRKGYLEQQDMKSRTLRPTSTRRGGTVRALMPKNRSGIAIPLLGNIWFWRRRRKDAPQEAASTPTATEE